MTSSPKNDLKNTAFNHPDGFVIDLSHTLVRFDPALSFRRHPLYEIENIRRTIAEIGLRKTIEASFAVHHDVPGNDAVFWELLEYQRFDLLELLCEGDDYLSLELLLEDIKEDVDSSLVRKTKEHGILDICDFLFDHWVTPRAAVFMHKDAHTGQP